MISPNPFIFFSLLPQSVSYSSSIVNRYTFLFVNTETLDLCQSLLFLANRILILTVSNFGLSNTTERRRLWSRISGGVRAASSESGSIDSSMILSMENKIKKQLNAEKVVVKDAYGDGRHVSIYVVSDAFEGQSAVNRQIMVYKAIWEELQSTVHAVDNMVTHTPSEAK